MPKTDVEVKLIGEDGNAFYIIGKVERALKRAGHKHLSEEYYAEVTNAQSYDEVLQITMEYVEVI